VPAGVCVELIHNFSLIHDDIEDGDEERRYRPTLWKLWGVPQAINLGDGLFSMARFGLWQLAERGVPATAIVRLAAVVDRTCLELCEGQYLDMTFEGRADVTAAMYLDMIGRKTAALMASSTELGARIGDADERTGALMAEFGRALGMAFQLRDDVLGIWAASELGKSAAGDLRRRKMSLPIIHARENAAARDRRTLTRLFAQPQEPSDALLAEALTILEQTGARERATEALREQVALARRALDQAAADAAAAAEAHALLAALLSFVAEVAA
jgi:geranylgeranyl diphosphate synthase type I